MDLNQQIRKYIQLESKLNLYMISKGIRGKVIIKANEILQLALTSIFWANDDLIEVLRFERVKLNQKSNLRFYKILPNHKHVSDNVLIKQSILITNRKYNWSLLMSKEVFYHGKK